MGADDDQVLNLAHTLRYHLIWQEVYRLCNTFSFHPRNEKVARLSKKYGISTGTG